MLPANRNAGNGKNTPADQPSPTAKAVRQPLKKLNFSTWLKTPADWRCLVKTAVKAKHPKAKTECSPDRLGKLRCLKPNPRSPNPAKRPGKTPAARCLRLASRAGKIAQPGRETPTRA